MHFSLLNGDTQQSAHVRYVQSRGAGATTLPLFCRPGRQRVRRKDRPEGRIRRQATDLRAGGCANDKGSYGHTLLFNH